MNLLQCGVAPDTVYRVGLADWNEIGQAGTPQGPDPEEVAAGLEQIRAAKERMRAR